MVDVDSRVCIHGSNMDGMGQGYHTYTPGIYGNMW